MLTELYRLAQALQRCGLQPPRCHKWVKPLERGDFLIGRLDRQGRIGGVEFRGLADTSGVVKIQKDNQNGFPALKFDAPLWDVPANEPLRAELAGEQVPSARAALLRVLCAPAKSAPFVKNQISRISRMREFASELLPRFTELPDQCGAAIRVLQAVHSAEFAAAKLVDQITLAVIEALVRGEPDYGLAERLLIGTIKRKTGEVERSKVTCVFDIDRDVSDGLTRLIHPGMAEVYHRVLLRTEPECGALALCGLAGTIQEIEDGNVPSPKLPELNATILFAMNRDAPCHDRYGKIGTSIFPIGKETEADLNDSVLWVTAPEREHKTWRAVPREDGKTPRDLLIAYLENHPALEPEVAELFCGDDSRASSEAAFEAVAEHVMKAIDARGEILPEDPISLLLLRRINKGQVQVQLSRRYTVAQLRGGLHAWRHAAANLPKFYVLVPKGKGEAPVRCCPSPPSPAQVVKATRSQWIRGGTEEVAVPGLGFGSVYDLLLADGHDLEAVARLVLRRLVSGAGRLLLACGHQLHVHGPLTRDLDGAARQAAVLNATLLAICLHKLQRMEEEYMKDPAFLLGRFLALVDILHVKYCALVRKGDVPPQLLGNQHFAMAADTPKTALSIMGSRLMVYQQWAVTAKVETAAPDHQRAIRTAKWAIGRLAEISVELEGRLPDAPLDDAGRAEMLLGYLARIERETTDAGAIETSHIEEPVHA